MLRICFVDSTLTPAMLFVTVRYFWTDSISFRASSVISPWMIWPKTSFDIIFDSNSWLAETCFLKPLYLCFFEVVSSTIAVTKTTISSIVRLLPLKSSIICDLFSLDMYSECSTSHTVTCFPAYFPALRCMDFSFKIFSVCSSVWVSRCLSAMFDSIFNSVNRGNVG